MSVSPRVSILVTSYNNAEHIEEEIRCLTTQTYRNLEIVVSDDASTDETPTIIRKLAAEDPRIVPIFLTINQGLAVNYNESIKQCRGEYIATMDADDIWAPDKIARQVAYLDAHPECGLCTHDMEEFDSATGRTLRTHHDVATPRGPEMNFPVRWTLGRIPDRLRPSLLGRSNFLRSAQYDSRLKVCHEILYRTECMARTGLLWGHIPEVLGQYRIHQEQLTRSGYYQENYLEEELLVCAITSIRYPFIGPLIKRHRNWYLFRRMVFGWIPPGQQAAFERFYRIDAGFLPWLYLQIVRRIIRSRFLLNATRPVRSVVKAIMRLSRGR